MAIAKSKEQALKDQIQALYKNLAAQQLNAQGGTKPSSENVYAGQLQRDYPELLTNPNSPVIPKAVKRAYDDTVLAINANKNRADLARDEAARISNQIDIVERELKSINPKYISKSDKENQQRKDAVDVIKIISDANAGKANIQAEIARIELQISAAKARREETNRRTSWPGKQSKAVELANNDKEIKSLDSALAGLRNDLAYFDQRNQTKEKTLNANLYTAMRAGDTAKVADIKNEMKANDNYKAALATSSQNNNYAPGYAYGTTKSGYTPIVQIGGGRKGVPSRPR